MTKIKTYHTNTIVYRYDQDDELNIITTSIQNLSIIIKKIHSVFNLIPKNHNKQRNGTHQNERGVNRRRIRCKTEIPTPQCNEQCSGIQRYQRPESIDRAMKPTEKQCEKQCPKCCASDTDQRPLAAIYKVKE